MTEHPYDIEITRVLEAPPERVYQAFTAPDQFARLMRQSECRQDPDVGPN
jgi:uncharacterized protein YndB with AHSA1/START domain